jgi:hypothetical protein
MLALHLVISREYDIPDPPPVTTATMPLTLNRAPAVRLVDISMVYHEVSKVQRNKPCIIPSGAAPPSETGDPCTTAMEFMRLNLEVAVFMVATSLLVTRVT